MTFKDSNWTRGELGHAIDRNPRIDCADCGESFAWQGYWKPRVVEGDRVEDPNSDEPWRCDGCHERRERQKRRRENNRSLASFSTVE